MRTCGRCASRLEPGLPTSGSGADRQGQFRSWQRRYPRGGRAAMGHYPYRGLWEALLHHGAGYGV